MKLSWLSETMVKQILQNKLLTRYATNISSTTILDTNESWTIQAYYTVSTGTNVSRSCLALKQSQR